VGEGKNGKNREGKSIDSIDQKQIMFHNFIVYFVFLYSDGVFLI
jgi:hypothetical protein